MKKVTVLVPCYNEEEALPLFYERICGTISSLDGYEWELLFINDGSRDRTLQIMRNLHARDSRVSYVDLSRNYGKEKAMLAGFDYAEGDCTIIMDADLQDPPELIPQMLGYWEEGYEDVYAKRNSRGRESLSRRFFSLMFYSILQKTTRIEVLQNVGDFRLLDSRRLRPGSRLDPGSHSGVHSGLRPGSCSDLGSRSCRRLAVRDPGGSLLGRCSAVISRPFQGNLLVPWKSGGVSRLAAGLRIGGLLTLRDPRPSDLSHAQRRDQGRLRRLGCHKRKRQRQCQYPYPFFHLFYPAPFIFSHSNSCPLCIIT